MQRGVDLPRFTPRYYDLRKSLLEYVCVIILFSFSRCKISHKTQVTQYSVFSKISY